MMEVWLICMQDFQVKKVIADRLYTFTTTSESGAKLRELK